MKNVYLKPAVLIIAILLAFNTQAQQIVKGRFVNNDIYAPYEPSFKSDGKHKKVKNVILMIGDGMGLAHVCSAMYSNGNGLTMTNLHKIGFVRTQSSTDFTTDSAASGTAYAAGIKTHNSAIGVDTDNKSVGNIAERLSAKGYATGIITTDNLDGATPSSFYAHQSDRGMSKEIWSELPQSSFDFFAGGNEGYYLKQDGGMRENLNRNFTVVNSLSDGKVVDAERIGFIPPESETQSKRLGRGDFLPSTTAFALDFLSRQSKKGFFIMVEGARIDKSSHDNDYSTMVMETLDFDKAVEAAIRFADSDGNTLVVISADHETGALSLSGGNIANGQTSGIFVSNGHSPIMVPLFAYGPYSDRFCGVMENSDVCNIIWELMK